MTWQYVGAFPIRQDIPCLPADYSGPDWVEQVFSATDGPLSALWSGLMVGGVYCPPGTRVLVKDQPNPEDNWIYVVKNRAYWEKASLPVRESVGVFVTNGANCDQGFAYGKGKWIPFSGGIIVGGTITNNYAIAKLDIV
jgi:hypothetical protein